MKEINFEKAKIGDRVWSFRFGFGMIEKINGIEMAYPLIVKFINKKHSQCYTMKGFLSEIDISQDLFWDEIKFEIPERPKHKVKKKVYIGIGKPININEPDYYITTFAYIDISLIPTNKIDSLCIITTEIEVEE